MKAHSDESSDQRLSPRKSISSGYESRFNSSSDSSSCTECDDKHFKKPIASVKREKRLTKQSKTEKKKRGDYDKWENVSSNQIYEEEEQEKNNSSNLKRRSRRIKNGTTTGPPSNLSPIPEGKVDCSIPPPIWPRVKNDPTKINDDVCVDIEERPSRTYHNGTTNPVNFIFKYNERYPTGRYERTRMFEKHCFGKKTNFSNGFSSIKTEYEHNWVECCQNQCGGPSCFQDIEDGDKNVIKILHSENSLENLPRLSKNELAEEVLRDLANLIAFAMSSRNSLSLGNLLKSLADSIQKSLDAFSQAETGEDLRILSENLHRNKYLSKILSALLNHEGIQNIFIPRSNDDDKNEIESSGTSRDLEKYTKKKFIRKSNQELNSYKLNSSKDDIYSSGSERKNSTSSSSGCKDLYMSSNSSSSAGKDNVFSASSSSDSTVDRDKPYEKTDDPSSPEIVKKKTEEEGKCPGDDDDDDNILKRIHHEHDFSSSSGESAFGSSDISPPPSDSSSAKDILNPVFLHEDIYSVPKSMRNAIIGKSLGGRTKNADCDSVRNCGSSAFEKLISAKRKTSHDSCQLDDIGPLSSYIDEGKTRLSTAITSAKVDNTILKKVEHPYYVSPYHYYYYYYFLLFNYINSGVVFELNILR